MSNYIDRLILREKKAAQSDVALERLIGWHQKRIRDLASAIAGMQHGRVRHENAQIDKCRESIQMHEATIQYLRGERPQQ